MPNNERPMRSHTDTPESKTPSPKARAGKSVTERNRLISTIALCVAAVTVLVGLIVGAVYLFTDKDETTTMNANVYMAGINTYGMTREDAISALRLTATHSYPKKL